MEIDFVVPKTFLPRCGRRYICRGLVLGQHETAARPSSAQEAKLQVMHRGGIRAKSDAYLFSKCRKALFGAIGGRNRLFAKRGQCSDPGSTASEPTYIEAA